MKPRSLWPPARSVERMPGSLVRLSRELWLSGIPEEIAVDAYDLNPDADILGTVVIDEQLKPQQYCLEIDDEQIYLRGGDNDGLRYGLATLWCVRQHGKPIAPMLIVDQPFFQKRGVLWDISRDRIPLMSELQRVIRSLARLKYNHVQLSIEHALAYPGHNMVWRNADALSLGEFAGLADYAAGYGIELGGNQNCYGHCERWLQWPEYAHLAELPDAMDMIVQGNEDPFSLHLQDRQARKLVVEWLQVQRQCLPLSTHMNIGGDETIDLGIPGSRSHKEVQRRGYGAVYGDHLAWLTREAADRGWTPQFWADIALEYPEALERIPDDAIALAWGYEANSPFDAWAEQLAGRPWWVCPGTAAWRSFTGRKDARRGSVAAALEAAHAGDATGFMMTEWGDAGHRQQWPVAWLGFVEAASAAWSGFVAHDMDYQDMCWHDLGCDGHASLASGQCGSLVRWLDRLSAVDNDYRPGVVHPQRGGQLINSSMYFIDLHLPSDERQWQPDVEDWQAMAEQVEYLREQRPAVSDDLLARECDHAADQASWALERAIIRRGWHQSVDRQAWAKRGEALVAQHQELWLARCRGGGLADSCRRYQTVIAPWLDT